MFCAVPWKGIALDKFGMVEVSFNIYEILVKKYQKHKFSLAKFFCTDGNKNIERALLSYAWIFFTFTMVHFWGKFHYNGHVGYEKIDFRAIRF